MLCGQAECFHIEWVSQDLEKLQGTRAASQIGSCKPEQSFGAEESQHQELQSEHGGKVRERAARQALSRSVSYESGHAVSLRRWRVDRFMSASKLRRACFTFGRNKIALGFP